MLNERLFTLLYYSLALLIDLAYESASIALSFSDAFPFGEWDSLGMLALASGGMNSLNNPWRNQFSGGFPYSMGSGMGMNGMGMGMGGMGMGMGGMGGMSGMGGMGGMSGMGPMSGMGMNGMSSFGNRGQWGGMDGSDTSRWNMDGPQTRWQN